MEPFEIRRENAKKLIGTQKDNHLVINVLEEGREYKKTVGIHTYYKTHPLLVIFCNMCRRQKTLTLLDFENRTLSCRCRRDYSNTKPNPEDLSGKMFGSVKVLSLQGEYQSDRLDNMWNCHCLLCERKFSATKRRLKTMHKSCGCILAKNRQTLHNRKKHLNVAGTYIPSLKPERVDKANKNNKLGIKGVFYTERHDRYVAKIVFKGVAYYLGEHRLLEDAIKARKRAEEALFGNFLEWYAREYPEKKKETKTKEAREKNSKKSIRNH